MRRPEDAQVSEILEADLNCAAALIESRVQLHAQAHDSRSFHRICGAVRQQRQAPFGVSELADQELAFAPVHVKFKGEPMPAIPSVFR
jgi:hypothetical protein